MPTTNPQDEFPPCQICNLDPYDCSCPECRSCFVCGVVIDEDGYCATCASRRKLLNEINTENEEQR